MASGLRRRSQEAAASGRPSYSTAAAKTVKTPPTLDKKDHVGTAAIGRPVRAQLDSYTSFAFIVIFAFSTFDTGHPFSAASANFWNVAASAPGTLPTTSMWLDVIVHPESSFSIVSVMLVEMLSGVRFAEPSCAESAIEKHPACAAAINSSGFVPGPFSNREVNEYCVLFSTPPGAEIDPFPSFNPPFQTALALRCMKFSLQCR